MATATAYVRAVLQRSGSTPVRYAVMTWRVTGSSVTTFNDFSNLLVNWMFAVPYANLGWLSNHVAFLGLGWKVVDGSFVGSKANTSPGQTITGSNANVPLIFGTSLQIRHLTSGTHATPFHRMYIPGFTTQQTPAGREDVSITPPTTPSPIKTWLDSWVTPYVNAGRTLRVVVWDPVGFTYRNIVGWDYRTNWTLKRGRWYPFNRSAPPLQPT